MRSATSIMVAGAAALVAAAPNPQDLNSVAANLPQYVSQLGDFLTQANGALSAAATQPLIIPGLNPTAAVSQLPAALASEVPQLESYAFGSIPTNIISPQDVQALESAAAPAFTQAVQQLDSAIAQLPQTLQVSSLGGYLLNNYGSQLPGIESAIVAGVSAEIPEASSFLTALAGLTATGAPSVATATATASTGLPKSTGTNSTGTKTGSAPIQTFTGAANSHYWGKEVAGAAAVVGIVGAML